MPPGVRKHELDDMYTVLKRATVIQQNKVCCGEALGAVHGTTSEVVLSSPCRRIRVTVDADADDTPGIWFAWGADFTNNESGRVMVTTYAPLDILLDKPEDHFFIRRIRSAGTVNVGIMGVF